MNQTTHTDSPCIGVCALNEQQICQGCFRNLDEIASWNAMNMQQRATINQHAQQRQLLFNTDN